MVRTTAAEASAIGADIAEKLTAATGPTALALPLEGTSELAVADGPFRDPAADAAPFEALRDGIGDGVEWFEMARHVNDSAFVRRIARTVDGYLRSVGAGPS